MRGRHTTRTILAIAAMTLAVALAVAGLTASSSSAKSYTNGFQIAKFKVEVKGVQKTVQQTSHLAANECDVDDFSSGSEKIVFETTRPVTITASYYPGLETPLFFTGKKALGIPTKAKVKRSYTPRVHGTEKESCAVSGGDGGPPPVPDCGTKAVDPYIVELQYADSKKGQLMLAGDSGLVDPFEQCPGAGGASFPILLTEKSASPTGPVVHADLPQSDLFDPKFRKWISLAEGSRKVRSGDWWAKTEIQWDVSFTRLGR